MDVPERRHLERVTPERLVYIDLKPDNGGIVLNVSDEGLCFQAVAPVKKHESVAFSFSEHNLPTDAVGEVIWTDEARKYAGLRFTEISAEARDEIQDLLKITPRNSNEDRPSTFRLPLTLDNSRQVASISSDAEQTSPLHLALLREAESVPRSRLDQIRAAIDLSKIASMVPRMIRHPGRIWLVRAFVIALIIYAVGASIALQRYRKSQRESKSELAARTIQSSPQDLSVPVRSVAPVPATGTGKPSSAIPAARQRARIVVPKTVIHSTPVSWPRRPVIRDAPLKFEYPTVGNGIPSGTVDLRLLVGTNGSVQDVRVLAGNRTLANASVRAVRNWRYRPFEFNGHPVEAEARVRMRFLGDEAVTIRFHE